MLAELAADICDDMALDAVDICDDMTDEADIVMAADPVELAVAVWLAAQDAAVGRFVTPAGTQMLLA